MEEALIASVLALGGLLVYRLLRASKGTGEQAFKDALLADAASWIADKSGQPIERVRNALHLLSDDPAGSPAPDWTDSLLRIECEIHKVAPDRVQVTVIVAWKGDTGTATLSRIERSIGWEDLPDEQRSRFIREPNETKLAFVLVESPPGKRDPS